VTAKRAAAGPRSGEKSISVDTKLFATTARAASARSAFGICRASKTMVTSAPWHYRVIRYLSRRVRQTRRSTTPASTQPSLDYRYRTHTEPIIRTVNRWLERRRPMLSHPQLEMLSALVTATVVATSICSRHPATPSAYVTPGPHKTARQDANQPRKLLQSNQVPQLS
jgi:hypothetical protein